jgi:glycine dehydrogenase subunit 2
MLIEPTETESKRELDRFCDALLALARAAKTGNDRGRFTGAPHLAPLRRLDETLAARKPKLTWRPEPTTVAPAPLAAE